MKWEMMTPHVEKLGIYRFRQDPGQEIIYIERHKKTVHNVKGEI